MESAIFKSIGLNEIDPAIIFIIVTSLIVINIILMIIQTIRLTKLKTTYNKFMNGKDGKSLESEMIALFEDIRFLKNSTKKADEEIDKIKKNLLITYQKVGIVRYDAFREMGGKLSFSIALLNDKNDGFIINSVHSSDGCYTYTKEIVGGESYINLGEEEQEALDKAMNSRDNKITDKKKNSSNNKEDKNPLKSEDIELDIKPLNLKDYGFEEVE